ELQARGNIEKVLIICPRPLITEHKWKNEMKRFGEDFDELDSNDFKYCIDYFDENESWSDKHNKIIVPDSLFNQQLLEGLEQLDPKPQFDLVIVDEAHKIRNADSYKHKVVNFFCENAKAVVFLTATPIQMHNNDLFTLLNVLRPDLISDKFIFDHLTEPNRYINQAVNAMRSQQDNWQETAIAALENAQNTDYGKNVWIGNPEIQRIQEMLQKSEISRENRIDMIARTEKLHTLSHVINRTRRREIGNFTQRNSQTVESTYTAKQRELYEKVIVFIAKLMSAAHQNISVRFMMTTLMRQISSSLFALQPFLQDILQNKINQLDYVDYEEDIDSTQLNPYTKEIQDIINLSGCLKPADDDKLTQLKAIIRQKQAMPNNKMIVFSTFRHTLNYLHKELQQSGFRVGLINGDTPQEERLHFRSRFEQDKKANDCLDILLFSEVGCEGLDYQFCDCLVNYDIPWNPMKIEQRIGRIDRKGQKAEKIAIYNFITKETIDADIYERCLNRIGIFESAIGQTDEILGDIVKEINEIAADFTLTNKERQEKLETIADNEIKQQQEKEKLEQDSAQLFGIDLSQEQIKKEVENAHSFWLSPTALVRFIQRYLQERLGKENAILGSENNKIRTILLSQENRLLLKEDFDALYQGKVLNLEEKEWKEWLKSNEPYFSFAFKGEENTDDKKTHFISPRHPLIRQAVNFLNTHDNALEKPVSFLKVSSDIVPAGDYPFAVYSWLYQGYRSDFKLKMICENQALTQHLEKLLEQAQDYVSGSLNIDDHIKERLEKQQKALYDAELQDYKKDAEKIIAFKKEQLEKSAERRIAIYENNIQQAKNEKYKKGEQTKIDNLQQQPAEKCKELDTQLQHTALNANPIAFGV
ncbi:MAG: DEAD/DEAH box helicase family protein, partial [Neisseriaceae bacterium]|nr:DEAD/DEAH box helicase family protein [Neisseriaceae bacterium]